MQRIRLAAFLVLAAASLTGARAGEGDAPAPVAPAAAADAIVLKDGRRLEGEVVDENERFVSLRSGGVTRAYAKDAIATVERHTTPAAGGAPAPSAPAPAPESTGGKEKKKNKVAKDAPLSPAAEAWLADLIARVADPDESIRRAVAAAIGAMGPPALGQLRTAEAAAGDGPQKAALGRIAGEIEVRRDRRGRGDPGVAPDGMGGPPPMPGDAPGGPRAGGPGRRPLEDMMQKLTAELELREDQTAKVRPILEGAMKRRFELARDVKTQGLSAEEVDARVAPLREDLLGQMKAVLDEPQYALFEEMARRLFEMQRGPMAPPPMKPEPQDPPQPAK